MSPTKIILVSLSTFTFLLNVNAQDWDKNYPPINYEELIGFEKSYADSIDKHEKNAKYYSRLDKYRFTAIYSGEKRAINDTTLQSMKNVFKLYIGNPEQLDGLVKSEYKFKVGNDEIWMPIQQVLEKPFKKEISKGDMVKIYCLFLNEHTYQGKLFNTFLISEFQKAE